MLLLLLPTALISCNESDSPTIALPATRSLNGTFGGAMPVAPPGEDWSSVVMVLQTSGDVSGVLKPAAGIDHSVGGTYAGTNLILSVGDLPSDNTCVQIQLNVFRFEFDLENNVTAFDGTVSGNCPGPLSGSFRMERQ